MGTDASRFGRTHDYRPLCRAVFLKVIASDKIPSALRAALMNHERAQLFVDNLAVELSKAQDYQVVRKRKPFDEKTLRSTARDMVEVYIASVIMEGNRRAETEIARVQREQAALAQRDLESTAEGKPKGDFADAGVTVIDERVPNWTEGTG